MQRVKPWPDPMRSIERNREVPAPPPPPPPLENREMGLVPSPPPVSRSRSREDIGAILPPTPPLPPPPPPVRVIREGVRIALPATFMECIGNLSEAFHSFTQEVARFVMGRTEVPMAVGRRTEKVPDWAYNMFKVSGLEVGEGFLSFERMWYYVQYDKYPMVLNGVFLKYEKMSDKEVRSLRFEEMILKRIKPVAPLLTQYPMGERIIRVAPFGGPVRPSVKDMIRRVTFKGEVYETDETDEEEERRRYIVFWAHDEKAMAGKHGEIVRVREEENGS